MAGNGHASLFDALEASQASVPLQADLSRETFAHSRQIRGLYALNAELRAEVENLRSWVLEAALRIRSLEGRPRK